MTWTQIAQTKNHEAVYRLANEMIKRVGMMIKHYEDIGAALNDAIEAYNGGKMKLAPKGQSIITTAKHLIDLGAKSDTTYPIKELVDVADIPQLTSSGKSSNSATDNEAKDDAADGEETTDNDPLNE